MTQVSCFHEGRPTDAALFFKKTVTTETREASFVFRLPHPGITQYNVAEKCLFVMSNYMHIMLVITEANNGFGMSVTCFIV